MHIHVLSLICEKIMHIVNFSAETETGIIQIKQTLCLVQWKIILIDLNWQLQKHCMRRKYMKEYYMHAVYTQISQSVWKHVPHLSSQLKIKDQVHDISVSHLNFMYSVY